MEPISRQALLGTAVGAVAADVGGGCWSSVFCVRQFHGQQARASGSFLGRPPGRWSAGVLLLWLAGGMSLRPMDRTGSWRKSRWLALGPFACGKKIAQSSGGPEKEAL